MGIVIEWRGDQSGPVVVCDHCQQQIAEAADGNAQWQEPSGEALGVGRRELSFTHKRCYDAFSRDGAGIQWLSQELEAFLWFLTNNIDYDPDAGEQSARGAAMLG